MKLIKLSLMTCAMAAACVAQAAMGGGQTPPGVTVYGFDWRIKYRSDKPDTSGIRKKSDYAWNDPLERERRQNESLRRSGSVISGDPGRLEMPAPAARPTRKVPNGYESSLQLKNTGTNAIRAVEWEHVFYGDKARQNEVKRFKFRREMNVEPGEQKFVSQAATTDDRSKLATRPRQSVVITLVEYSDGSVWQRR